MSGARKKRILVVEDDGMVAELLQRRLALYGFVVHCEDQGLKALAYASQHRPDLVILDLRLPDMHGYDVAHQLRKLSPRSPVPILILTATEKPTSPSQGKANGFDAYMTKPYDASELLNTVSLLLEQPMNNTTPRE